ncbi:mobilization protein [Streptomyces virginiae]|uniref:Mobilization protein n=1 Tax=Streptomyces virginiae TaxID=1961 RepID=A0ABQ3NUZ0_STRVG|nr:relaxase/mobilization nuclease domain-containing protein [Streptomyces virginiae]MBP2345070.1 hypothetical protein [Streptomyces virginiae]GGP96210.1 mobilization protein [Streptomyces virginiae]GHI16568.1 mobilization protein [Streptomyces virginiae]
MIPRLHKMGTRTIGLIYYLYGPGTNEEHTDPHLIAAWDPLAPDPGRNPHVTYADLQKLLNQPVQALPASRRPAKHVWHLSVRAAPEDPILTDEQWGEIARRMVSATGIDPGDGAGCRWAAVRHADDHIHIVATTVREDGRKPRRHNEAKRAQAEARLIEADYGMRRLNPGDGTAARRPTSAERHKANRHNQERTPRETLRETVRQAVAGAQSEEEFFARLAASGLLVRQRVAPSGDLLGYTVALPDDRNRHGEPVFYSGSKLAPDLSLPRIRERFTTPADSENDGGPGQPVLPPVTGPAFARRRATAATWQALLIIDHSDDGMAAAQIAAAAEVLDALAKTSAAHTRKELRDAAIAFERASRSHVKAVRGHDRALRQAARDLVHSGPALSHGEDGATTAMLIDMAFFLATTAANWHAKKLHAQQAAAAQQAAEHLRAAYQRAAAQPIDALRQRGQQLALHVQRRQAGFVRRAVPELAEQILAEPGWPALAATLTDAQKAGHDPVALLAEATHRRELDTATSISDVLVWRLRRSAHLPAAPAAPHERSARGSRGTLPAAPAAQPTAKAASDSTRRR